MQEGVVGRSAAEQDLSRKGSPSVALETETSFDIEAQPLSVGQREGGPRGREIVGDSPRKYVQVQ